MIPRFLLKWKSFVDQDKEQFLMEFFWIEAF